MVAIIMHAPINISDARISTFNDKHLICLNVSRINTEILLYQILQPRAARFRMYS